MQAFSQFFYRCAPFGAFLQHPDAVFKQRHGAAIAAFAGDAAVLCTDHHVLVQGGVVHAAGCQFLLGKAGAAHGGAGVAVAKGDVAGSVLVKQGVVEQLAAAVNGAGGGHQCHLTDVACALVGVQQLTQQICALVGAVLHHLAILEGNVEILDQLSIKDVGLCAVNDAVHLILMGRGEHLLGGDVGQEGHAQS